MSHIPPSPNLQNIQNRCGHVTIQQSIYVGGFLFKVNSQYKFDQVVDVRTGCGCNGTTFEWRKHYRLIIGNNAILIDAKNLVETNVPIPKSSQDFNVALSDQFLSQQPYNDFDGIRNNPDPTEIWKNAQRQAIDFFKH